MTGLALKALPQSSQPYNNRARGTLVTHKACDRGKLTQPSPLSSQLSVSTQVWIPAAQETGFTVRVIIVGSGETPHLAMMLGWIALADKSGVRKLSMVTNACNPSV